MIITFMEQDERINKIFIDSSAFIALNDPGDKLHNRASRIGISLKSKDKIYYTATNVLLEVSTLLSQKLSHREAVEFLDIVRSGYAVVIHPSEKLISEAEAIFKNQSSKNVSYSDCVSFAIMQEYHIKVTFSFDRDFKKNGFKLIEEVLKN